VKTAFIFPGQGAQKPKMGLDLYESYTEAKDVFQEADDILSFKLSEIIFKGTKEELAQTNISQIAIYVMSMATLSVINSQFPQIKPSMTGGLSLGEYTALTTANKISFKECLLLVKARGELMQKASLKTKGTMAAVMGIELSKLQQLFSTWQQMGKQVWIANLNCPGQIVISGSEKDMLSIYDLLKKEGARRVFPLDVSGAFHSGLMQSAKEGLAPLIQNVEIVESDIAFVSNYVGDFVTNTDQIKDHLIEQVTSIVRWEDDVKAMNCRKPDLFIEIGPGKTLAGMNRKIGVDVKTISIETIVDLEQLAEVK